MTGNDWEQATVIKFSDSYSEATIGKLKDAIDQQRQPQDDHVHLCVWFDVFGDGQLIDRIPTHFDTAQEFADFLMEGLREGDDGVWFPGEKKLVQAVWPCRCNQSGDGAYHALLDALGLKLGVRVNKSGPNGYRYPRHIT